MDMERIRTDTKDDCWLRL